MKKALFLTFLGFGLVLSTAYLTYQNMQLYMNSNRSPSSAINNYNEGQITYLRELRNLNAVFRKEIEVCESEFENEFGWYLKMEVKNRRNFLKKDFNLFAILKKLEANRFYVSTTEDVLEKLTNPISKSFKQGEVLDAIGYYSFCKLEERGVLFGDLLDVSKQKKKVAHSLLNYFKRDLLKLQYPSYSVDILGFIGSLENLLGRDEIDFYRIQDLMDEYYRYYKSVIKKYKKSGFDFDRGGPKFNHDAQVESYEFAKRVQPKIIKLISDIQRDSI